MQRLINRLAEYATEHLPNLPVMYDWRFKEDTLENMLGIRVTGVNWYEKNLDLRRQLCADWQTASPARRRLLADYKVRVWGGVKTNAPGKVDSYVQSLVDGNPLPFEGIASWSKVACIAAPEDNAILDARVGFSLNALQFLSPAGVSTWFPGSPGRNTVIEPVKRALNSLFNLNAWPRQPKAGAYATYIQVLQAANRELPEHPGIHRLEMLLFAKATELATQTQAQLQRAR